MHTVYIHIDVKFGFLERKFARAEISVLLKLQVYIYIYLESPTTLNFWGLSRKMTFFPESTFLKLSTLFCVFVIFIHGGSPEVVEII